jgi:hypothetical protein
MLAWVRHKFHSADGFLPPDVASPPEPITSRCSESVYGAGIFQTKSHRMGGLMNFGASCPHKWAAIFYVGCVCPTLSLPVL